MQFLQEHGSALKQGTRIQHYELMRVLGAGSFGITYLAFDHNLERAVAIKEYFYSGLAVRTPDQLVVPNVPTGDAKRDFEWGKQRFIDEARLLAHMDHRNVVRIHDYIESYNTAYMVMEYIEGNTLQDVIRDHGPLSTAEWWEWLDGLMEGLEHVHSKSLLHRDIKPSNIAIQVAEDGGTRAILIDFGSARRAAAVRRPGPTVVYTPGFAPIEQYSMATEQNQATDIYGLAAVSYFVLTGEAPPDAASRSIDDKYRPLTERPELAASPLAKTIDQGLRLERFERHASIAAWRKQILREETGTGEEVQEAKRTERTRRMLQEWTKRVRSYGRRGGAKPAIEITVPTPTGTRRIEIPVPSDNWREDSTMKWFQKGQALEDRKNRQDGEKKRR